MKKYFLVMWLISNLLTNHVFSQCTPDGSITTPGVISSPSSVECISRGVPYSDEIQFMNFDQILFNGSLVTLQRLRIDSVNNLPCGINWQLNNENRIYQNSEPGCISISGITYDTIGQYKLDVWASIDLGSGFLGPLQANNFDLLTFYTRVKYPSASCPFIDTLAPNTISKCNSTYGMQLTLNTNNDFLCWNFNDVTLINTHIENGSGHYSYQWNYADSLSCSDCPSVFFDSQIFQTGVFPVTVTVYDSISTLSATQTIEITVAICGSVEENEKYSSLVVYPNPGNGNFTIEFPHGNIKTGIINLMDLRGSVLYSETIPVNGKRAELNFKNISSGIYLLETTIEKNRFLNKIIIR